MTPDLNLDWLISVDDHILEPPSLWVDRVAAKDRDRAPHMETIEGMDYWIYDGKRFPSSGLSAVAGKSKEEFSPEPMSVFGHAPRVLRRLVPAWRTWTRAGILASLCFPTITRFCGQLFMEASDREFGFECLQHYNDWIVEEWCGAAPGRYIPLMLIPMWDPPLAAKEMERMAAKGVTAFAFSENPAPIGLPTIHDQGRYWDPVMSTANELGMVASMHVGRLPRFPRSLPTPRSWPTWPGGPSGPPGRCCRGCSAGCSSAIPTCKIALSEGEIGWMPYFLERAEQVLDKQRYWVMRGQKFMDHATTDVDLDTLNVRELFREHVFGCFIEDHHGIASLDEIGEDNVMCETDYPHSDSTWPNCITAVKKVIGHLPPETQYKLLRGNAERLYRFTPAEPPVPAHA